MHEIPTHVPINVQLLKRLAKASHNSGPSYSQHLEALSRAFGAKNFRHFKASTEAALKLTSLPAQESAQEAITPASVLSLVLSSLGQNERITLQYAQALGFAAIPPEYGQWVQQQYPSGLPLRGDQINHLWDKYQYEGHIRIIALLTLEEVTSNDDILPCRHNAEHSIDVTGTILEMSLSNFQQLEDNQYSSDNLASRTLAALHHNGPFSVHIESYADQWLKALQMPSRGDLTESDWADIKSRYTPKPYSVTWSKVYYASGTEKVLAMGPAEAEEMVLDRIGDLEGSLQYAGEQDEVHADLI